MKHKVEIVTEERYCIEYCIDGCHVTLNRTGAAFDLTDTLALSNIISSIENALKCNESLIPFAKELNGKNLFRILDALFYDSAYQNWVRFFDCACDRGDKAFKRAFVEHYGFYYSFKSETTRLYNNIRAAAEDRKHHVEAKEVHDYKYTIVLQSIIGNVATYLINGDHCIEICLRGKPEFKHARNVLSWINQAEQSLVSGVHDEILNFISEVGGKAFLQFAEYYADNALRKFLIGYVKGKVITERKKIDARKELKHFFGSTKSPYYYDLLSSIEQLIPWADTYLVESNDDEINSVKDTWALFQPTPSGASRFTVNFYGPEDIIRSTQDFCRLTAKQYRLAEKQYANHIYNIAQNMRIAISSLEKIGLSITKITDLTALHFQGLKSYMIEQTNYSLSTQRLVLLNLRSVHLNAINSTKNNKNNPILRVRIPPQTINVTQPIETDALTSLPEKMADAPAHIQIALGLALATGARANSICNLKTSDFSFEGGKYIVSITLYKTIEKAVPIIRHEIDHAFAEQILQFIRATEHLRRLLPEPYLLVYQTTNLRDGSSRIPAVLNADVFKYYVIKYCNSSPYFDKYGYPLTCAFRTLRASYGHELFLAGISETEAARRMGNTEMIKAIHYTSLLPSEDAELHHKQYEQTIIPILQSATPFIAIPREENVMYGTCNTKKPCNQNNCAKCDKLIKERK